METPWLRSPLLGWGVLCEAWLVQGLFAFLQLRLAVVEALGPMSYLMPGDKLEEQLPRLIPGILALYKKHGETFYVSKVSSCTHGSPSPTGHLWAHWLLGACWSAGGGLGGPCVTWLVLPGSDSPAAPWPSLAGPSQSDQHGLDCWVLAAEERSQSLA